MLHTRRYGNWYEITVPKQWSGMNVDQFFRENWSAPKKLIHQFRMEKKVLINDEAINWDRPLKEGDRLKLKLFEPEEYGVVPSYLEVDILYEDDHFIVFNKPSGMDTHPNSPEDTQTLSNAAAFHLQLNGEKAKIRHVHRLDRDTTGAILFAKHALAGALMDLELEKRKIKRTYFALVDGIMKQKKGVIDKAIGRDRHHPTRRRVSPTGQKAITRYKLIEVFPKENMSLVQCQLDTGRTHQIRVHFSSLGYPLSGDTLYDGSSKFKRQALHAIKLEFTHPFTLESVTCIAPFIDKPEIFKGIDPYTIFE